MWPPEHPMITGSAHVLQTDAGAVLESAALESPMSDATLVVKFEYFERTFATWDTLFAEAAEFATQVRPERLIGISHSHEGDEGVVTVWYWDEPGNDG
jgi:hypothetical protein